MNRLVNKIVSSVLATSAAASLAACGGGSHSSALPQPAPTATAAAQYTGPLANATLKITIPVPTSSSSARRPSYVSSATSKVVFTLNSASNLTAPQVTALNSSQLGAVAVTLGSGTCPGSGPWTCTITIKLPPGNDNITVSAQDASSNILSQQIKTFSVTAGGSAAGANNFSLILDANANTMAIVAMAGFCAGSFTVSNAQNVGTVGTTSVTFNASYKDLAGKTIIAPGLPLLTVNGHTDDNAGAGYTDATTHLNVKVTQSTQSFTLSQTAGTGNAAVTVGSSPPGSDGLSFSQSLGFTFQSGPAPPPSFLAAIEQTNTTPGSMTGQIDLFTLALGSSDTFTTYGSGTLTPTGSPAKDVDNPQDILFDPNGDLLIANGGAGNPDFGNFACLPAGAIATGANAATIITSHANDPTYLALGTDSSVAIANRGPSVTFALTEYVLSGQYAEAPSTREIQKTGVFTGLGINNVVALPATAPNPSGTYAAAFSNGTNPGSSTNMVSIFHPDGTHTDISDNTNTISAPVVGYDSAHDELAIAGYHACNSGTCISGSTSYLDTYTVGSTPTQTTSHVLYNLGGSPVSSGIIALGIAVSPTGYIAVYGGTSSGNPEVQVYDNVPGSRAAVGGPIPFDGTTTPGGATGTYGTVVVVQAMRWLTGTKLLVALQSDNAVKQGFYIFDVSQLVPPCVCYDINNAQFANSPKNTGFHQTTNHPLAAAYKP